MNQKACRIFKRERLACQRRILGLKKKAGDPGRNRTYSFPLGRDYFSTKLRGRVEIDFTGFGATRQEKKGDLLQHL